MTFLNNRYFILNKPYNMVSQFVSTHDVNLLGDVVYDFPLQTHAIGRLDKHSEGLLLLTTDKKVTRLLFSGIKQHKRTYLVMVQNIVSDESLQSLRSGISIKVKTGIEYIAKPHEASIIENPSALYKYATDHREQYPHTWLLITLTEGKFHQVRKMVLALRHRCLRLIRVTIEDIALDNIKPGEVKELDQTTFYSLLNILNPHEASLL